MGQEVRQINNIKTLVKYKTLRADAGSCMNLLHQHNVIMAGARPEVNRSEVFRGHYAT